MGISSLLSHIPTTTNNINKRLCRSSSSGAEGRSGVESGAGARTGGTEAGGSGEQGAGVRSRAMQCGARAREGLVEDSPSGTQSSGSSGDTITAEVRCLPHYFPNLF